MVVICFWLCALGIFYTYAGYPLLLFVLAAFRPARPTQDASPLDVTLLIAAYNEADVIAKKIEESLCLDYPAEKLQILVAADGSDDATPEIVRRYEDRGVDLSFSPPRRGKMAAITNAVAKARGEVVVISDANNTFGRQAIGRLVAHYADPRVGAVGGAKHIVQDGSGLSASEGLYWKYESYIKSLESRVGSCIAMPGEILSFRRELFKPPQQKIVLDDVYVTMLVLKQGYRVAYEPSAKSFEHVSVSASDEFERRARNVAGRYDAVSMLPLELFWQRPLVMWQWLSHKLTRMMLPFLMLGALLANIVIVINPTDPAPDWGWMGLSTPIGAIFLAIQLAFYALAGIGRLLDKKGVVGKLLYVPSFLVSSNMAALAGFYRHVMRRQGVTWQRVARRK